MTELMTWPNLIALLTLTGLEIVLGIDNIVFLALITSRVPKDRQPSTRRIGLLGAMGMRILLLLGISWVTKLTTPLFTLLHHDVSGRDLILFGGGLFLIAKSTLEIHHRIEGEADGASTGRGSLSVGSAITQIMILDLVFSLDSVITAVGMARHIYVMIAAVVIAVAVMMIFAGAVSHFIERHPTLKMLALSFLLLIGVLLVMEGSGRHIEHGYIYFAMAFALLVEILNIRSGSRKSGAGAGH